MYAEYKEMDDNKYTELKRTLQVGNTFTKLLAGDLLRSTSYVFSYNINTRHLFITENKTGRIERYTIEFNEIQNIAAELTRGNNGIN